METSVIQILKTIPTTFSINDELINSLNSNYIKINSVYNEEYTLKLNKETIILYYFECAENFTKIINFKTEYQVIYSNLFGQDIEYILYKNNKFYNKNNIEIYDIVEYIKKFPIVQISIENQNILKKYSIYIFSHENSIYYLNNENDDSPIIDKKYITEIKFNKDKFQNTVLYELFNLLWFYILCGFLKYNIGFNNIILNLEGILHNIFKDNINVFLLNFCLSIIKILIENDLNSYYLFSKYYYIYFNKYLDPSKEDEINIFLYNYKNQNRIEYNNVYKQIVNLKSKIYFYDFLKEFVKNISKDDRYNDLIKSCDLFQDELEKEIKNQERNINDNLFQLLDIENWISFKNDIKFLFRSYEYNDPRLLEFSEDISKLMNECFNVQKYNIELKSKWLLMFDEEKKNGKIPIGFMTIDNGNTIWNVCVKKEYRKHGIATKLMEKTINFVCKKGGNPPTLLVDKQGDSYDKLIKFYKSFGFEIWNSYNEDIVKYIFRNMGPDRYTYMIYNCKNIFVKNLL